MVLATSLLVDMFVKHINKHLEPKKIEFSERTRVYKTRVRQEPSRSEKENPPDQNKKNTHKEIHMADLKKKPPHPRGRSKMKNTIVKLWIGNTIVKLRIGNLTTNKIVTKIMLNSKFPQAFPNSLPKWAPIQIYTPLTYTEGTNS